MHISYLPKTELATVRHISSYVIMVSIVGAKNPAEHEPHSRLVPLQHSAHC